MEFRVSLALGPACGFVLLVSRIALAACFTLCCVPFPFSLHDGSRMLMLSGESLVDVARNFGHQIKFSTKDGKVVDPGSSM